MSCQSQGITEKIKGAYKFEKLRIKMVFIRVFKL